MTSIYKDQKIRFQMVDGIGITIRPNDDGSYTCYSPACTKARTQQLPDMQSAIRHMCIDVIDQ